MYKDLGQEVGQFTDDKREQYGDSVSFVSAALHHACPDGIPPYQYDNVLLCARMLDKVCRILTRGADGLDKGSESPYKDLAGYALIGVAKDEISAAAAGREASRAYKYSTAESFANVVNEVYGAVDSTVDDGSLQAIAVPPPGDPTPTDVPAERAEIGAAAAGREASRDCEATDAIQNVALVFVDDCDSTHCDDPVLVTAVQPSDSTPTDVLAERAEIKAKAARYQTERDLEYDQWSKDAEARRKSVEAYQEELAK